MVHRAMPTRSTVTYGSLLQARPSRCGLQVSDRIAPCPACGLARRINVNDVLYTHLSGETRTVGLETEWVHCDGSRQHVVLAPLSISDSIPYEFAQVITDTERENFRHIRLLEDAIQVMKDHTLRPDPVAQGRLEQRIKENLYLIEMMRAENEFFGAIAA
jgi:hypothetical protein